MVKTLKNDYLFLFIIFRVRASKLSSPLTNIVFCSVYRLKEARKRNIQPLRPLLTKPGSLDPRDDEDDDDSGISSHGNGTGSVSLPDLSNTDLTVCLSSASLKNPAYLKAKILWDFKSSRPGTELSVEKGEIVHMLYREGDKVLVLNSSEKRGFIPLRYCSVLQKKIQNPYTSISRPQKQHYNDPHFNKKLLTNMEQAGKNARYINTTNSNSRFGTKVNAKNCNHEQTNVSSSSEEDSDYSFRGTSDYPDMSPKWNRNAPDNFRQRQKLAASYFRKSEETKMLVLYDFIARDENDISVYKGEIILVLNRDDSDWWWIATPEGYEGFVPKVFLSRLSSVSSEGRLYSESPSIL